MKLKIHRVREVALMALVSCVLASRMGISGEATGTEQKPTQATERLPGLQVYGLRDFGPGATPAEVEATYRKALETLTKQNGGILLIPEDVTEQANLENVARWSHSVDPASCSLKDWKVGPGVLVIDNRQGTTTLRVPQVGKSNNAGITLERTLRLPKGDSLTHWTEESVLNIENNVIHGPCNYMEWISEPVKAGKDARFYVPTARNLFRGMYLNAHQGPGYGGQVARITVKDIGWDKEKKLHYFTADTNVDHVKAAIVQNKSHTPAVRIMDNLNAANQTFDFYLHRNQYANGDSYMFDATFGYMDNVHSMPGDENGVCYTAYIRSLTNIFTAKVKTMDVAAQRLVFEGAQNANTLSNSRPLVNLNEKKWTAKGKVVIVPPNNPAAPYEEFDDVNWVYEGKSYPSKVAPGPVTGSPELYFGGLIRGDKDCPWDASIIGRFFAVDEQSEYITGNGAKAKLRRWYEIAGLTLNPDGSKDIKIKRYWWGTKAASSPTLYDPENYTRDGHVKPLSYVIAPGAYVNDVSDAVGRPSQAQGKPPFALSLAPGPDTGTPFDLEPGDAVEQAIGADPFKPQGLRVWCFDSVPGAWPSAMIDLSNHGDVARASAVSVGGGPGTLEDAAKRHERRPAWDTAFKIDSAAGVGLECNADFANAAILFAQPNHEQSIKWYYARQQGKPIKEATLTVSKDTGDFRFKGGDLRLDGGIVAKGLSADEKPARNLRGKNVPVKEGEAAVNITFPAPEADGDYAVFVEQNWLSNRAVVGQTEKGFKLQFDKPAPKDAKLHWMIVR